MRPNDSPSDVALRCFGSPLSRALILPISPLRARHGRPGPPGAWPPYCQNSALHELTIYLFQAVSFHYQPSR
jgi:hypothetical protein